MINATDYSAPVEIGPIISVCSLAIICGKKKSLYCFYNISKNDVNELNESCEIL